MGATGKRTGWNGTAAEATPARAGEKTRERDKSGTVKAVLCKTRLRTTAIC